MAVSKVSRYCTAEVLQALSVYFNMHKKQSKVASGQNSSSYMKGSVNQKCQRTKRQLSIGCWNMRTLVEAEGPIETSVSRPGGRGVAVDRKVTLMIQELKQYSVNLTAVSETKWFRKAIYQVEGYTILHSGRPVPSESPLIRNEGVGIVLDPVLTAAWREEGETWKAVSPRVVSARLKIMNKLPNRRTPTFVTVVSMYAPTFRATPDEKEAFYSDLQSTLNGVDERDLLLLVGDFNARVGSAANSSSEETWNGVRGIHGVGRMNGAGADLLTFCALNELTIVNTCFTKKNIHNYTWQHPGNKQWYCIDYIIMRQKQRHLCSDAGVVRSADCWTDHKLLCVRIRMNVPRKTSASKIRTRYAISSLRDAVVRERYSNEGSESGLEARG